MMRTLRIVLFLINLQVGLLGGKTQYHLPRPVLSAVISDHVLLHQHQVTKYFKANSRGSSGRNILDPLRQSGRLMTSKAESVTMPCNVARC
jgi:hypothetical protein